jgi:hypothetical protein
MLYQLLELDNFTKRMVWTLSEVFSDESLTYSISSNTQFIEF